MELGGHDREIMRKACQKAVAIALSLEHSDMDASRMLITETLEDDEHSISVLIAFGALSNAAMLMIADLVKSNAILSAKAKGLENAEERALKRFPSTDDLAEEMLRSIALKIAEAEDI